MSQRTLAMPNRWLVGALSFFLCIACGEKSYSRSEMNPRKEAIYRYASSLCEIDEHASVMSIGPMGAPTHHPARLKMPYPTRADFEAVIGKPDHEETQRMTYTIIGGMGKEEQEDNLALIWWEKDSRWEKYGAKGWEKTGHREIITAWFDPQGRLKKLFFIHPYGSEFVGRHSGFWEWAG